MTIAKVFKSATAKLLIYKLNRTSLYHTRYVLFNDIILLKCHNDRLIAYLYADNNVFPRTWTGICANLQKAARQPILHLLERASK